MVSAFICYKWEDESRNRWVHKFYSDLRKKHGIDAKLDTFEVGPGDSFIDYMVQGIRDCDYLLFIITPESVKALEDSRGGVSFEMNMALARQIEGGLLKIIPIYREGDKTPAHLRNRRYMDFRDDGKYEDNLVELAKWLKGNIKPPAIVDGTKPKPPLNITGSTLRKKPEPVSDTDFLNVKADLYSAGALTARAGLAGELEREKLREKLNAFSHIKVDSGTIKRVNDGVVFLAYFPSKGANDRLTIKEVWVKAGKWGQDTKGVRLTKDLGALISEALDDVN